MPVQMVLGKFLGKTLQTELLHITPTRRGEIELLPFRDLLYRAKNKIDWLKFFCTNLTVKSNYEKCNCLKGTLVFLVIGIQLKDSFY